MTKCTQCGLCTQVCLVERLGERSIASLLSGSKQYSPWLCSSCWKCQDVCPENVDIHELMIGERRKREVPEGYQSSLRRILECGYSLPLSQEMNQERLSYGLSAVELIPKAWVETLVRDVVLKRPKEGSEI